MTSPYDARGIISDTDFADERIHVQDAMFIFGGRNDTVDLIKRAIMKYGAVTIHVGSAGQVEVNATGDDIAVMDHSIHFLSVFGWDDNYMRDGELKMVWLCKDSLGELNSTTPHDGSVLAIDYYAIVPQSTAIAYIFENTIDYHVNYQTDLTGLTGFDGNYAYYSNEFISEYSELIGAVGTYFRLRNQLFI
jgi:C1A family cysteine protease